MGHKHLHLQMFSFPRVWVITIFGKHKIFFIFYHFNFNTKMFWKCERRYQNYESKYEAIFNILEKLTVLQRNMCYYVSMFGFVCDIHALYVHDRCAK